MVVVLQAQAANSEGDEPSPVPLSAVTGDQNGLRMGKWSSSLLLVLLCLVLYLPGIASIPPIDRDEALFAEVTKQMVITGDLMTPKFLERGHFKKPIGIYWLQAATVIAVTGRNAVNRIWAYRLTSVGSALIAVLLTWWIGRQLFDDESALLAAALLASSILMATQALLARTDAALLACTLWAFGCLAAIHCAAQKGQSAPWRYAAGFWIALGAGMLIKGPVIPGLAALTIIPLWLAESREERVKARRIWFKALHLPWGVPLMLAIVLPWAIAIDQVTHGEFYRRSFGHDILPKLLGGQEGHGEPPGYYTLLSIVFFWPGSLLLFPGLVAAYKNRTRPAERFLFAWLVPSWIAFELAPTKLPHYVLPLYPALALLIARAVTSRTATPIRVGLSRLNVIGWILITVILAAGVMIATFVLQGYIPFAAIIMALATVACALMAIAIMRGGRLQRAGAVAILTGIVFLVPLREWIIPGLDVLWITQRASDAVVQQEKNNKQPPEVVVVGYEEPSLVFLLGPRLRYASPQDAAHFLEHDAQGLVLADSTWVSEFQTQARHDGLDARKLWSGAGINYSKGNRVNLVLFGRSTTSNAGASPGHAQGRP